MRIACIGDSCTFGQNVRADEAWPHLLWQMTGHDVRNLGVNGDTTRLGLERWHRDVDLSKPDVVVIQFGHNDANEWHGRPRVPKAEYRVNLETMVALAPRSIVLAPHLTSKGDGYDDRVRQYAAATYLDVLDIPILDDGYGVHPNPKGHKMYAEFVAERL